MRKHLLKARIGYWTSGGVFMIIVPLALLCTAFVAFLLLVTVKGLPDSVAVGLFITGSVFAASALAVLGITLFTTFQEACQRAKIGASLSVEVDLSRTPAVLTEDEETRIFVFVHNNGDEVADAVQLLAIAYSGLTLPEGGLIPEGNLGEMQVICDLPLLHPNMTRAVNVQCTAKKGATQSAEIGLVVQWDGGESKQERVQFSVAPSPESTPE